MKTYIVTLIIVLGTLIIYTSPNFITKKWQEYKLNREFVCPETQSEEEAESYLYNYLKFYKDNYPEITIDNLLDKRIELLISHDCTTTLQNLSNNINS
jgi:hypothetical protein